MCNCHDLTLYVQAQRLLNGLLERVLPFHGRFRTRLRHTAFVHPFRAHAAVLAVPYVVLAILLALSWDLQHPPSLSAVRVTLAFTVMLQIFKHPTTLDAWRPLLRAWSSADRREARRLLQKRSFDQPQQFAYSGYDPTQAVLAYQVTGRISNSLAIAADQRDPLRYLISAFIEEVQYRLLPMLGCTLVVESLVGCGADKKEITRVVVVLYFWFSSFSFALMHNEFELGHYCESSSKDGPGWSVRQHLAVFLDCSAYGFVIDMVFVVACVSTHSVLMALVYTTCLHASTNVSVYTLSSTVTTRLFTVHLRDNMPYSGHWARICAPYRRKHRPMTPARLRDLMWRYFQLDLLDYDGGGVAAAGSDPALCTYVEPDSVCHF